jgi:N-acetylneuraminic acid mutarotase
MVLGPRTPRWRLATLAALLSLGFATAAAAQAGLSFERRVACREKVEDVYWAHRLWPPENKTPKPPRETVVPRSAVAMRVEESLRYEAALAAVWDRPLTPEVIQAEIDREAGSTRDPAMLRALWAALGNDPNLVAECLVRPELAERRIQELYAGDRAVHAATRRQAESELAAATAGGGLETLRHGTGHVAATVWVEKARGAEHQLAPGTVALGSDEWAHFEEALVEAFPAAPGEGSLGPPGSSGPTWPRTHTLADLRHPEGRTVAGLPLGKLSALREDPDGFHAVQVQERSAGRVQVVTVTWPKRGFAEWWKTVRESFAAHAPAAGVYRLAALAGRACAYDTWVNPSNLALPTARTGHTAVWTGSEMIVWGGFWHPGYLQLGGGGRYTPGTDTWAAMSTTGAPTPRASHTAVWTGSEMIVWGGFGDLGNTLLGGRYQPANDSWVATSATGAPSLRYDHTAVWTGSAMIVWGGVDVFSYDKDLNDGAIYTPATDGWAATNLTGAPTERAGHTAVWTGTAMIVWGGSDAAGDDLNDGGVYTPGADSWVVTNLTGAPQGRDFHTAVWTGTAMIVWGGFHGTGVLSGDSLNDGGVYTPETDSWVATSAVGAPGRRSGHTAVWTGSEMIVWGGSDYFGDELFNSGGRYTPETDSWAATSTTGAPVPRYGHTAVWTGTEMIVWGGEDSPGTAYVTNTGGRYQPETDSWIATNTTGAPAPRYAHTAVWTGVEMIVWGGHGDFGASLGSFINSGARYAPGTDSWVATSTTGAPTPRSGHTAVWTGSEMIVWGGDGGDVGPLNGGGRYTPGTDSWAATSTTGAPLPRIGHTAVWTGSAMIVWGGYTGYPPDNVGGLYTPRTDSWVATSTTGAPTPRSGHSAVWTGSEMTVWGGFDSTGGRYAPGTDSWVATSTTGAPEARNSHTAVWTGSQMIVWGGLSGDSELNSGGLYTPGTDSWVATNTTGAPTPRAGHTAVWTGSEMIVWSGDSGQGFTGDFFDVNSGGRYAAGSDSWMATNTTGAPEPRTNHTAVWTGREMIVWGGQTVMNTDEASVNGVVIANGGLYCAVADAPPVAYAQSLVVVENGSLPITLAATDPDGDALTYAIVGSPAHGTLSGMPPAVTYLPAAGYFGPDSFTFKANDGVLDSNVATISLRVDAPPVANAQSLVVAENGSVAITLTATDPDGDALTYAIAGSPAHGTLSGTPPAVTYAPAGGYFGADSFTFKANDGRSDSNVATVAIAVKPYGYLFYTVPPCRLFDSRSSTSPLLAGVEKVIQAGGLCGVPAAAGALAVNVTVVSPTESGYLNLYATPGNPPPTSVHDFAAGQVRANNAVVQVSQSGSFVALFTMSSGGKADLVVDVSGYFE